MNSNLQFVDTLPVINNGEDFLILKSQKNLLADNWFDYMQVMIKISLSPKSPYFKTIRDAYKHQSELAKLNSYAKNILGVGDEFSVITMDFVNGELTCHTTTSYSELIDYYFGSDTTKLKGKFAKRAIIDRFLAYLWSKGLLLYPLVNRPEDYQRAGDWKALMQDTDISKMLDNRFEKKDVTNAKKYQKTAIYSTLAATTWYSVEDITEEDLSDLEYAISNAKSLGKKRKGYFILVLNELRYTLINHGRLDIVRPRDNAQEKKSFIKYRSLEMFDLGIYPNLAYFISRAYDYPKALKNEGLATGTIDSNFSAVVYFLKYLTRYYPNEELSIETVDTMFDPDNEHSLINVLIEEKEKSAYSEMNTIIKFLTYCDLYSIKARKNTPKQRRKKGRVPYRSAMPRDMVQHIVDIIKNRPPNSTTNWSREEADVSWWPHAVYPIYPMMMLVGYYIPLRGEQIRYLCRVQSFIFNQNNEIDTIVVNTDKNVNREYLQEIPCVWDDLQIFVPFLEWHKAYFKHLPKVVYHEDDNTPWEEIEPIFITPQVLKPLSRGTHFDYHKKVLCQYQLEVMEQAKERGDENYPRVAWAKKGKIFFKNKEELDNCSSTRMNDIDVMYDLHSLRVTGATRYLESGVGLNVVMMLTGHMTPDTLTRIYINLTMEEKKEKLKSAIRKIYFGDEKDLLKSSADLLAGELTEAYDKSKEEIERVLADNALFSFHRKMPPNSSKGEYAPGTEIALSHHPSTWSAMVHGLCPAVKCPDGRDNRCSLCPYLITGKLFLNGITLKINQSIAIFQRDALTKQEEEKQGYKNPSLAESMELTLEEILGWWEILESIEAELQDEGQDNTPLLKAEPISTELAYLKNAHDARMIGVEQDRIGLKILTIKAMKLMVTGGDTNQFHLLEKNPEKAIDYLMNYYNGNEIEDKYAKSFICELK